MNSVYLFSFRNKILYPEHTTIDPEKPDSYGMQRVKRNCLKLCFQVLYDPTCNSYDLSKIFRAFRYRILHFNHNVQRAIKRPLITLLSETPVEKVIDYMSLYLKIVINMKNRVVSEKDPEEIVINNNLPEK